MVTIVLPTRNEAAIIRENLQRLLTYCRTHLGGANWRIVIADNGSTDATAAIVRAVAATEPRVELLEIAKPGKGNAVLTAWKRAWEAHDAHSAFVFMDADLATDLAALPKCIAAIRSGADIATGSRYTGGARTERSTLRHLVSRMNRLALRMLFGLRISDPPCGCKAVNARVVRDVVPHVRDTQWFFDTELLIRAEAAGMRIIEIPVAWREPRRGADLRKLLRMTIANVRAIARLLCERPS